jgi:hypothetical protein
VLAYAINAAGRSTLLPQGKWAHYAALLGARIIGAPDLGLLALGRLERLSLIGFVAHGP